MIEVTETQFKRTSATFKDIAKQEINVEFFDSAFWVYGSELAVLRLSVSYNKGGHGFSKNLDTFYFKLNTPSICGEIRLLGWN